MRKPANHEFDAKVFIAKVGAGKTILEFRGTSTSSSKARSQTRCFTFKKDG